MVQRKITKKTSSSKETKKIQPAKKSLRQKLSCFCDKALLACQGIKDLLKRPAYTAIFIVASFIFAYIFTFFRDGTVNWTLLWSGLDLTDKLGVLGKNVLDVFANIRDFYGVTILLMSLLQGLCIALLVHAWKNRERNSALDGASTGGIGAMLGFIALGCPSCGVTFVTPLLTLIGGAGAMALTESVSRIFTFLAFLLLIYTVIQLGYVGFVIMSAKKYEEKHE